MLTAGKFVVGKSADKSQNVRLNELFHNLKRSYMGFSYLLEVLQAHCVEKINECRKSRLPIPEFNWY